MSTNINDYTIDEIFDMLSLNRDNINIEEINTKIKELENKMINSKLDNSTVIFIEAMKEKIYSYISYSGYENNIINYNKKINIISDLINTNNNKYFDRNIINKILIIDTKFRDDYDELSTNFNITLPYTIKNVISIQLSNMEFPNTWYVIDESIGNNFFHIKPSSEDYWYKVDISSGSYYYGDLFTLISTKLINIFSDENSDLANIEFSLNLSFDNAAGTATGDGKVNIKYPSTLLDTNFDLDFFSEDPNNYIYKGTDINILSKTLGWKLGFHINSDINNNTSYTSDSILDISGPRYLYLLLDDHNKSVHNNYIPFSDKMSKIKNTIDIFARISINGAAFSLYNEKTFSVYADKRNYDGPIDLNKIGIKVVDENGDILNLNNNNFSFTIKIETLNMN